MNSSGFVGFIGDRIPDQGGTASVYVRNEKGEKFPLAPRNDVRNHSPDGFQWGYGGSGPAQLALAICCYLVGQQRAQRIYQDFKGRVIARIADDSFELSLADARKVIDELESARADRAQ